MTVRKGWHPKCKSVIEARIMNAVGIDVSKGKSMASVIRPFGELVVKPFEVRHTSSELSQLVSLLKKA